MSDVTDYLFLEEIFIQRVREKVPGLAEVKGLPDLQALDEGVIASPSVVVVYLGDGVVPGAAGQGGGKKVQLTKQYWAFVLCINNADASNDGEAARREAGPLIGKMLLALQGWVPADDVDALCRSERTTPAQYVNGLAMFPFVFQTTFVFPRIEPWAPQKI